MWYTLPMAARHRLIASLADGQFHSGEQLGRQLAMSRAAVWKQIRGLTTLGLDVHAVRGRGYRLPFKLELLDKKQVRAQLSRSAGEALHDLELLHEVDSTNDYLKQRVPLADARARACIAEWQRSGRGRRGRQWVSPYAANLYLSLAWGFEQGLENPGGLSLASAVAVLRALHGLGIGALGLKWPNDILLNGAKLAGILLDLVGEASGPVSVVVGVGINVKMPETAARAIDQAWTDLSACATTVSRNQLAGRVLDELIGAMQTFSREGLTPFLDEWRQHDAVSGREIDLQLGNRLVNGVADGIDAQGALLIRDAAGVQRYHAGEISVRLSA